MNEIKKVEIKVISLRFVTQHSFLSYRDMILGNFEVNAQVKKII